MKVIYIISFPPAYNFIKNPPPAHSWYNSKGDVISVWRQDRGHVFAKDIKSFFPEVEFEVWRPDYKADKEYVHIFHDGITHRSFPSKKRIFFRGLKPELVYTSSLLIARLSELIAESSISRNLVIHIPSDFSYLAYKILRKFNGKVPFLHTVHLNPGLLNIEFDTHNPLKILHRYFIKRTYESFKKMLKEIALSEDRVEFFTHNTEARIHKLDFMNFDFNWGQKRISREKARESLKLPAGKVILLSSCRLVPEKQIDKLIRVLAGFPHHDFLLIISGSGEAAYEEYLKKLSTELGLSEKILFTGYLDKVLKQYYCASDVFISTSISEAGPVSVLKAISLELPVITTNTGSAWHLLTEYDAGMIIDKNEPLTWSNSFDNYFSGGRIKTIKNDILIERFDLKIGISQLVGFYQKALNNFWYPENIHKTIQK